jgi:ABC-2 type transport system ATP-binding protein
MAAVLETTKLTKRFGRFPALRECDLSLPSHRVVGLVGPNGAGKTTLLQIAVGLRYPTSGTISVLGRSPVDHGAEVASRVGFVAQDRPLYGDFTVEETLELARHLNPLWDHDYTTARVSHFRIPLDARIRRLSTGQRAQVALAVAIGKRPALLLLDEPVANLDPLSRLELLEELMGIVADGGTTVIMSANALADVERVCDHLVVLIDGQIRVSGDLEEIVEQHRFVSGPREGRAFGPAWEVVDERRAERQSTWIVRRAGADGPPLVEEDGTVTRSANLEEIVLAYLRSAGSVVLS